MKNFKVALMVAVLPVLIVAMLVLGYLIYPVWFPKFSPGSCLRHKQVERVYLVVGYDDWFKGTGIPAVVLQPGAGMPGAFYLGQEAQLRASDAGQLEIVACPRVGAEAVVGPKTPPPSGLKALTEFGKLGVPVPEEAPKVPPMPGVKPLAPKPGQTGGVEAQKEL